MFTDADQDRLYDYMSSQTQMWQNIVGNESQDILRDENGALWPTRPANGTSHRKNSGSYRGDVGCLLAIIFTARWTMSLACFS